MTQHLTLAAAALLLLTACGSSEPAAAPVTTVPPLPAATANPSRTPVPDPTATMPTRTPSPVQNSPAATMTFDCLVEGDYLVFSSMEEALEAKGSCDGKASDGDVRPLMAAWGEKSGVALGSGGLGIDDLETYLGICASTVEYPWDFKDFSSSQAEEVSTSLKFCPDHPKAKAVKKALVQTEENLALEAEKRRVPGGSYFVPEEAAAGRWVSEEPVEDCYWEVTSASGGIVANKFATKARQIEFTVREGQSFTVEGCGVVVNK